MTLFFHETLLGELGSVNTASVRQVEAIRTSSTSDPFGFLHEKVCGAPSGNNFLFRYIILHPTASILTHAHSFEFCIPSTILSLLLKQQEI